MPATSVAGVQTATRVFLLCGRGLQVLALQQRGHADFDRQVQTAPAAASTGTSGQAYGAMWPSLVRMWKEEGFRGFMKGNGINVVRVGHLAL